MAGEPRLEFRCLQCGEPFAAQRPTARYCRNACRQMAYLRRRAPPDSGGLMTLADLIRLIPTPPDRD